MTHTIIQRVSLVAVAVVFITTAASAQEPNPAKDAPETQSIKRDGKRTNGRNHESGIPPQVANGAGEFVHKVAGLKLSFLRTRFMSPPRLIGANWLPDQQMLLA